MTDYELEADGTVTTTTTGYSSSNSRSSQSSYDTIRSGRFIQAKVPNGTSETDPKVGTSYLKQSSRQRYEWGKRVRLILALTGILGIVAVIFVLSFYLPNESDDKKAIALNMAALRLNLLGISRSGSAIKINNTRGKVAIVGKFSKNISAQLTSLARDGNKSLTLTGKTFTLSLESYGTCWNVSWLGEKGQKFEDCFDAKNSHWYGAAELYHQAWPLERGSVKLAPFLSRDLLADKQKLGEGYGGVLEPYFLNSNGGAIYVDRNVKLHVSINEKNNQQLCLRADETGYPKESTSEKISLLYTVCVGNDVRAVHLQMRKMFLDLPQGVPDIEVLTKPVWSTWARYKRAIDQSKIEQFVDEIIKNNMTASQIEIDDKYSTVYGDLNFDADKFSNPSQMIKKIHQLGFRVTVWVYPFANVGSHAISSGLQYWVKGPQNLPGLVEWWNGVGAVLDTTNPASTRWFILRLKNFQEKFKIDSFKFDAGEVSYLPHDRKLNSTLKNPNYFSTNYVQMASSFRGLAECRVGYHSQKYPLFVRMLDRTSSWGIDNGLKSVLTTALTFGILGYPFILPDMVGGNAYGGKPEKELYVRWVQLSVFLPTIQFSITPWDYDRETITLTQKALQIRYNLRNDFLKFTKEASLTGVPIIRPLWWIAPVDPIALKEDSQFMVGSKYLIAPVLEKGAKSRRVYLPAGTWIEKFGTYKTVTSIGQYYSYNITLKDIPYFVKQ